MSSARFATPLSLELRRSPRLAAVLVFTHAVSLATLFASSVFAWWLVGALSVALLLSLWRSVSRYAWLSAANAVVGALWDETDHWVLELRSGTLLDAELAGDTYISPPVLVLRFVLDAGGRRHVVVLGDMADPDTLRRLRVRLRQHVLAGEAS